MKNSLVTLIVLSDQVRNLSHAAYPEAAATQKDSERHSRKHANKYLFMIYQAMLTCSGRRTARRWE